MTEEQLKTYDIYVLIDKSGSMGTPDMKGGQTRWKAAQEQTLAWAREAQNWDADGISVGFYNNKYKVHENVTPEKVADIFKEHNPAGSTDTHEVLEYVLNNYFDNGRKKPVLIFVITDGGTSDEKQLARVIAKATQKMDRDEEIGIQFLQIGKDPEATKLLTFLDDNLVSEYKAKFDIVDTNNFEEAQDMPFAELCSKTLSD